MRILGVNAVVLGDTGGGITSPAVLSNTTLQLLLLSGDVETNPGPESAVNPEGYEQDLVEGLAKLCRAAPSESVRNVLRVWSPTKPGNEVRNAWQQGRRFLAPELKGTLAWLTVTRECDINGTKHAKCPESTPSLSLSYQQLSLHWA